MKFLIVLAALFAAAHANGYGLGYGGHGLALAGPVYGGHYAPAAYGHVIPPRIDIAPGQVETAYINKVVPQPIVTKYSTPIVAPVIAKVATPIIAKVPVYAAPVKSYGYGHGY